MSNLVSKIAAVSLKVGSLTADKRNEQQKYDYISADKILERAGEALAQAGIVIDPSIIFDETYQVPYTDSYGKTKTRYDSTVHFAMKVTDGETELVSDWRGRGNDYAVPDKAFYKAVTSGHKYFLMKLLNIGVGNEDGEHEVEPEAAPRVQKAPASTNTPKRAQAAATPQETASDDFLWVREKLSGRDAKFVAWTRELHLNSDGPCSIVEYKVLADAINEVTQSNQHDYILSVLCQTIVNADINSRPGAKVAEELIPRLEKSVIDEDSGELIPNKRYKEDVVAIVKKLAKPEEAEQEKNSVAMLV